MGNLRDPTQIPKLKKKKYKEYNKKSSVRQSMIMRQMNDGDNMNWQEGGVTVSLVSVKETFLWT